jgi:hypothetical protein
MRDANRYFLLSRSAAIGTLTATLLLCASPLALADTTSGGVSWPDTTVYQKPAFISITTPNEATAPNKYYVDMTAGSGTTCSQAAPCNDVTVTIGKAGTTGTGAFIYVKGSGYLNLNGVTFYGSPGSEIVIKPWPGSSTPAVFTAQSGCNRPNANTVSQIGGTVHDIIIDGGPNMLFTFKGSGCTGNQNGYDLVVCANDLTVYRVELDGNNSGGPVFGPAVGSGCNQQHMKMINSDITNGGNYYGVYGGGGTSCSAGDTTFTDMRFLNNVIRHADGRGIQIEPRANSDGLTITGNVFYDIGYDRSGNNAGPSAAVQPAISCNGSTNHILIANNMMWNLGGGCVRVDFGGVGGASTFQILNNTCWDYAKASGAANTSSHGIGSPSSSNAAEVRNNIIIGDNQPGTVCALDCTRSGSFVTGTNMCESTAGGCGSNSVTATAAQAFSTTSPSLAFLMPSSNSPAIGAGADLYSEAVTIDYLAAARPSSGAFTIGAVQGAASSTGGPPAPPPTPSPPTLTVS